MGVGAKKIAKVARTPQLQIPAFPLHFSLVPIRDDVFQRRLGYDERYKETVLRPDGLADKRFADDRGASRKNLPQLPMPDKPCSLEQSLQVTGPRPTVQLAVCQGS
jgi:hypothetical protein